MNPIRAFIDGRSHSYKLVKQKSEDKVVQVRVKSLERVQRHQSKSPKEKKAEQLTEDYPL